MNLEDFEDSECSDDSSDGFSEYEIDAIQRMVFSAGNVAKAILGTHSEDAKNILDGCDVIRQRLMAIGRASVLLHILYKRDREIVKLEGSISDLKCKVKEIEEDKLSLLDRVRELESCHKETVVGILQEICGQTEGREQ